MTSRRCAMAAKKNLAKRCYRSQVVRKPELWGGYIPTHKIKLVHSCGMQTPWSKCSKFPILFHSFPHSYVKSPGSRPGAISVETNLWRPVNHLTRITVEESFSNLVRIIVHFHQPSLHPKTPTNFGQPFGTMPKIFTMPFCVAAAIRAAPAPEMATAARRPPPGRARAKLPSCSVHNLVAFEGGQPGTTRWNTSMFCLKAKGENMGANPLPTIVGLGHILAGAPYTEHRRRKAGPWSRLPCMPRGAKRVAQTLGLWPTCGRRWPRVTRLFNLSASPYIVHAILDPLRAALVFNCCQIAATNAQSMQKSAQKRKRCYYKSAVDTHVDSH